MIGLLNSFGSLILTLTGEAVVKGVSDTAFFVGCSLINILYIVLAWRLLSSSTSAAYAQAVATFMQERPTVALPAAVAIWLLLLSLRDTSRKRIEAVRKWAMRRPSPARRRRGGAKEYLRRALAWLFRMRATTKGGSSAARAPPMRTQSGRRSRLAPKSFAVDVDEDSPTESWASEQSLQGREPSEGRDGRRPRVSIQLVPLPRLSIDFSPRKESRDAARRQPKGGAAWAPSMQRIPSGLELSQQAGADSTDASAALGGEASTGHLPRAPPATPEPAGGNGSGGRYLARRSLRLTPQHRGAGGAVAMADTSDTTSEADSLESSGSAAQGAVHRASLPAAEAAAAAAEAPRRSSLLGYAWRQYAPAQVQRWACSVWEGEAAAGLGSGGSNASSRRPSTGGVPGEMPSVALPDMPMAEPGTPEHVRQVLTDDHLTQFRALMGESGYNLNFLKAKGIPLPYGSGPECLFGPSDPSHEKWDSMQSSEWEPIVSERSEGLEYSAMRRPMRNKFFMYRTKIVLKGARPLDVRRFHLDDFLKTSWDDTLSSVARLPDNSLSTAPIQTSPPDPHHAHLLGGRDSAFVYNRCKFPRPFKDREYVFCRRVWDREDGGCYVLIRSCGHAAYGPGIGEPGRTCNVTDYVSGLVLREVPSSIPGEPSSTVIETLYFEDSKLNGSFASMAVKKGLWSYVEKFEAAFRLFERSVEEGRGRGTADPGDAEVDLEDIQASIERARRSKRKKIGAFGKWTRRLIIVAGARVAQGIISQIA